MAEHPNVARIQRGLAIRKVAEPTADDMAFLWDLFADDVAWAGGGNNPFSGGSKGKEAVFAAFGRVESGGKFTREVEKVLADDDYAVAFVRNTADRGAKHMEWNEAIVFHFNAGGQIAEFRGIHEDLDAVDELWATPVGSNDGAEPGS